MFFLEVFRFFLVFFAASCKVFWCFSAFFALSCKIFWRFFNVLENIRENGKNGALIRAVSELVTKLCAIDRDKSYMRNTIGGIVIFVFFAKYNVWKACFAISQTTIDKYAASSKKRFEECLKLKGGWTGH